MNKTRELQSHVAKLRQEIDRVKDETQKVINTPVIHQQPKKNQFDMDDFWSLIFSIFILVSVVIEQFSYYLHILNNYIGTL